MKVKGIFISTLLVVDTFLMSYAAGFHSRHVLVVNPKLPPVVQKKVEVKPAPVALPAKKADTKGGHGKKDSHGAKTHGKGSNDTKTAKSDGKSEGTAKPQSTSPAGTTKAATEKPADSKTATKPAVKPAAKPAVKPAVKPQAKSPSKSQTSGTPKQVKYDPKNPGA